MGPEHPRQLHWVPRMPGSGTLCSLSVFLRVVFAASNLEEWGNNTPSHPKTEHTCSKSHRFPKFTYLSITQTRHANSSYLNLSAWPPWDLETRETNRNVKLSLHAGWKARKSLSVTSWFCVFFLHLWNCGRLAFQLINSRESQAPRDPVKMLSKCMIVTWMPTRASHMH